MKKILIILLVPIFLLISYFIYEYNNSTRFIEDTVYLYLPDTSIKVTDKQDLVISKGNGVIQNQTFDTLSTKDRSEVVFISNLTLGQEVTKYTFVFKENSTYKNINLSDKHCEKFLFKVCHYYFKGFAYIDKNTNEILRLQVTNMSVK